MVAGLHLEEFAASPVITDLQSVRIEVFVEVIREITVERFEHDLILADNGFAEEVQETFTDADLQSRPDSGSEQFDVEVWLDCRAWCLVHVLIMRMVQA